jgi:Reverse transcriptase (RNA-dependent DNA polymerase)
MRWQLPSVTLEHFIRAATDIGAHGDNDTLPFDVDNRFVAENTDALAKLAFSYFQELELGSDQGAKTSLNSLQIFSERLLVPTGPAGFRITTKIHPFWNIYFNGLGVAIAEAHEPSRSPRVHSYRFAATGNDLFGPTGSWRLFREACIIDCETHGPESMVVQTDISSFYEHSSHHRIQDSLSDLLPGSHVATQIDRLLSRFASGRSFGLPVGGQCSRVLAELFLASIDQILTDSNVIWRRFVDDFVLVTANQAEAYRALAILSHALADYGLTLNRTKTTVLTSKHFVDYVRTQIDGPGDEAAALREIDLHFDPYSDTPEADYEQLKDTVDQLDVARLLDLELRKGQPDRFTTIQIGRTLRLHSPKVALQLCSTLLVPQNLHAFRASWSSIMRGIASVCADPLFATIHSRIDVLLDAIPNSSAHLLLPEASCLHYLKAIRFRWTQFRAQYVLATYSSTTSQTVKRACIECWRAWKDRTGFNRLRNRWNTLNPEEQRSLWLAAADFDGEGENFRAQVRHSIPETCRLGIERQNRPTFASIYTDWSSNGPQ